MNIIDKNNNGPAAGTHFANHEGEAGGGFCDGAPPPSRMAFPDGRGMFNRRLGMFIHWGIYSVGGLHEQERLRYAVPRKEYAKYAARFDAAKFDPDHFIDVARSAGAEYIVFTAKHHDGFCMWDTGTTDFKVTNTPAGRDVVGELAAACRRRGMRLGLYYSNPDWNHPNAYNDRSINQAPLEPGDVPDMGKSWQSTRNAGGK